MYRVSVEMDAAQRQIDNLASGKALQDGVRAGGLHVKRVIAEYPSVSRRPQPFTSARQRRGFFAKLRSGEIQVPYVRGSSPGSQRLGQRWRTDVRNGGLTMVVSNNASYAGLVHKAGEQTGYHAGTGWKTDEAVARSERGEVIRIIDGAMRRDVGR